MRKLLIAAAALALAGPGAAQAPYPAPEADDAFARALPQQQEIDEIAFAMDRLLGAMLDLDIGPIVDAVEPYRRDPYRSYRGERTLRDMAGRDDPWFEDRMRHSLYAATEGMGRMMSAFAVAAPAMRRSIEEMERNIDEALRNAPPPRRPYHRD